MEIEIDILSEYIRTEMAYDGTLDPDADLLEQHVLDSFSIVQMAVFIEERFEIELEQEDLVRANLSSLSKMAELIQRRRAARA